MYAIVALDLPTDGFFSLDTLQFKVTPEFRGVVGVSDGLHLVTAGLNESADRTCLFLQVGLNAMNDNDQPPVILLRWQRSEEILVRVWDPQELHRVSSAIYRGDFNQSFARISEDTLGDNLLSLMDPRVAFRIQTGCGGQAGWNWSTIPSTVIQTSITGCHLDKTPTLKAVSFPGSILSHAPDWLPSELHAAFLLFIVGQKYEGFMQWKALVVLQSHCMQAIYEYPHIYKNLCLVLAQEVTLLPNDFLIDPITEGNFFAIAVGSLLENIKDVIHSPGDHEGGDVNGLVQASYKLKNAMDTKFGPNWAVDEGPILVDSENDVLY